MEGRSRRTAVIIMGILTLILAIVAVIIGLRLQEGALPDNSSASTVITTTVITTTNTGSCTISDPSVTGCITLSSGCGQISGTVFTGPAPSGTTNDGGCVGYSQNGSARTFGPGTYCPSPSCGQCQQIDINYNGTPYGAAKYGGACSNTTTARTTTTTTRSTTTTSSPACGNGVADSGEQCGEPGLSCPAGYSCNSCLCVPTTATCGNGIAEAGEECGEPGLSCPIGSTCSSCLCQSNPQCGQACGAGGTCPTGHTCSGGICKLNYCLQAAGNCSDGSCNPITCGEQCAPGGLCPTGHTCQSNICVANQCLNGGCSDKCHLDNIPRTALISDDVDRALLAGIIIVLGYLMLRFKLIDNLWLEGKQILNLNRNTDKVETEKNKKPRDFEDRFN